MFETKNVASGMVLLMFLISGIQKLFQTTSYLLFNGQIPGDSTRLVKKVLNSVNGENIWWASLAILFAGLWELVPSLWIIYTDLFQNENTDSPIFMDQSRRIAAWSLILFTLLATLIFYIRPLKWIPVLANISTIGGLLFLTL